MLHWWLQSWPQLDDCSSGLKSISAAKERTGPPSANQGVTKTESSTNWNYCICNLPSKSENNFCYATKTWPTVSVRASLIALLLNLDLDYLCAARTASVIRGTTLLRG